jgi:hypothetical protein
MEILSRLTVADAVSIVTALGALSGILAGIYKILARYRSMESSLMRLDAMNKTVCHCLFAMLDAMTGGDDEGVLKVKEELREHLIESR